MVIKIGGSLLYKGGFELNALVLNTIKRLVLAEMDNHSAFVFVTGGGKLSRELGGMMKDVTNDPMNIHAVAMEATQLNSHVLKGYLGLSDAYVPQRLGDAYEYLINDDIKKKLMVSGGLKQGWSTDMDAAVFADILKEKEVYKITDVEGVYTSDPRNDSSAKLINDISWKEFMKKFSISEKVSHKPNQHVPVSSESAIFCERKGITMYLGGGTNINSNNSLKKIFELGTKIHP